MRVASQRTISIWNTGKGKSPPSIIDVNRDSQRNIDRGGASYSIFYCGALELRIHPQPLTRFALGQA